LVAAAAWALLGVTTVFNIYIHTQPLATFFALCGIAALLVGKRWFNEARIKLSRSEEWKGVLWLLAAGILLGLGVVSRKSVLATGLVPLAVILVGVVGWRRKVKGLVVVGLGFVLVLTVFLSVASFVYGTEGFWEAAGFNSAEDGVTAVDEAEREQVRAYSIRGMTPFFRESLPLIMLAVLGLGYVGEWLLVGLMRQKGWFSDKSWVIHLAQKLAWLVPLAVFSWAWSFFKEYEGSSIMLFGMWQLWWVMLVTVVLLAAWPSVLDRMEKSKRATEENKDGFSLENDAVQPVDEIDRLSVRLNVVRWLVPVVWVVGLVMFYMSWIKFHANYIGEFLPPLVILAGVAIPELWRRMAHGRAGRVKSVDRMIKLVLSVGFVGVLGWSLFVSGYITFVHEHTGTFQQGSLQEAAQWAKDNIPMNEPIFTGAAAVPYLSRHRTALDIAHPRWYAYEFTRKDTKRLETFLPSIEEMVNAYREANWFMLDKQTGFSFIMEYSEIEAVLSEDWERGQGIENGSNTLTFYKRIIR